MSAAPQLTPNPFLDKDLWNAFIDGVKSVFSTMAGTEVTQGKPYLEPRFTQKGKIFGVLDMETNNHKGRLFMTYTPTAIFKVYENMIGEVHTEVNKDIQDCVGEITNMTYGAAKTKLNEIGYTFNMAIPNVIYPPPTAEEQNSKYPALVIPFTMKDQSQFYVEIIVLS